MLGPILWVFEVLFSFGLRNWVFLVGLLRKWGEGKENIELFYFWSDVGLNEGVFRFGLRAASFCC